MTFSDFFSILPAGLVTSGFRVVIISLVLFSIYRFVGRILDRSLGREKGQTGRRATLRMILRIVSRIVFFLIYLMIVLPEFGFAVGPLIASMGVVGLAFTFGAQSLVRDLVAGFFLLLEDLCRVGEEVEIEKIRGRVEGLQLRTIVIRDAGKGTLVFIPYGEIKGVENYSRGGS